MIIRTKVHDHTDHVPVWKQAEQLAGEAAVPYGIVGGCEIKEHSTGLLFSLKAVLDVLGHKSDLIYGRFSMPKTSLLPREKRIYNWFDAGIDKNLEDFEGDTKERYRLITLQVPWWLMRLGDRDC